MTWWTPVHIGEITAVATTLATIFMATFTCLLYKSTNKLWESSETSLKQAAHAFEQTERAFVFLDGFTPELTTASDSMTALAHLSERYSDDPGLCVTRFAVQPKWKNGGNTPTVNMTIRVGWQFIAKDIPPSYLYGNSLKPFFIAPKAIESSTFIDIQTQGVRGLINHENSTEADPIPHGIAPPVLVDPKLLIWGRADYKDVFGHAHFTEWCREVRFERHDGKKLCAGFIQWGDYNRSN